jgi:hypothetical protein
MRNVQFVPTWVALAGADPAATNEQPLGETCVMPCEPAASRQP